jgi:CDP-glycerol glycerophosphotransferase
MWSMRAGARKLAVLSTRVLASLTPKGDAVVIRAVPDFDDQAVTVHRALRARGFRGRITWLLDRPCAATAQALGVSDAHQVRHPTPASLAWWAAARTVFFTHGLLGIARPPLGQIVVNLWHGMPMKPVLLLHSNRELRMPLPATWTLATSPFYSDVMAAAMGVAPSSILNLGNPKNDLLFSADPEQVWPALGIDRSRWRRIVSWLPTYRESAHPGERLGEPSHPLPLESASRARLERVLEAGNTLLIVKAHPLSLHHGELPADSEHIRYVDTPSLVAAGVAPYEFLGVTDAMISDVSSVWVDYLVTDKPMLFFLPDIDAYRANRGMMLEPYEDWIPGPLACTEQELLEAVESLCDGDDPLPEWRRTIRDRLNHHPGPGATDRLLDHLGF